MYDEQEDVARLEWCRKWSEEHKSAVVWCICSRNQFHCITCFLGVVTSVKWL